MEFLSTGTIVFLLAVIFAYGLCHLYLRYTLPTRHYYRTVNDGALQIERDGEIVDNATSMVFISYSSEDPFALHFNYVISHRYFEPQPMRFSTSVERGQIAHALATGTSENIRDTADIFSIFCSPAYLKGKGKMTFVWSDPQGSADVHLLTVPTHDVLKVVNASYDIVAPGEELSESSNNLDHVLDEILQSAPRSSSTED